MSKAISAIILVAVLTVPALFSGCGATVPGNVVTEEKDFADFTYVTVEGTFEVEIVQSDSFSITISADSSFYDYVDISKEGQTLRIRLSPRHTFTDFTLRARNLKAQITMPDLYGLYLSGASKGTITGFKSSHDLNLEVSGASSLDIGDVEAGNVEFQISGASKITGIIKAIDARLKVSGASKVELEGSARKLILNASGASKINLADFPLDNASINLSGASEATINVKGRLDSVLSDAASLFFQGNPTMGDTSISGASTIKHR